MHIDPIHENQPLVGGHASGLEGPYRTGKLPSMRSVLQGCFTIQSEKIIDKEILALE